MAPRGVGSNSGGCYSVRVLRSNARQVNWAKCPKRGHGQSIWWNGEAGASPGLGVPEGTV